MFGFGHRLQSSVLGGGFVGPLDDYAADLVTAILPFRGLSSYAGSAWRIRDTVGSGEQEVAFDAGGSPIFPTTTGQPVVGKWYNQVSSDILNVESNIAANQPLLVEAILGEYPVVRFDGVNDELGSSFISVSDKTIYFVVKKNSSASSGGVIPTLTFGLYPSVIDCNVSSQWSYYPDEFEGVSSLGGDVTSWSLISLVFTGSASAQAWINGVEAYSFVPLSDENLVCNLGENLGSGKADMDVAAVLQYTSAHDSITRGAIQSILATMFGITLA